MAKNQGTVLAATTTKKTKDLGDPNGLFTFVNDGVGSVFLRQQDEGRTFVGTAAEINALGGGRLAPGRTVTVKGVTWDYVCGSDTGTTAAVQVLAGVVGSSTMVELAGLEVNLGNVGVLDSDEVEIDPAIKSLQLERHLEIDDVAGSDVGNWTKHVDLITLVSSVKHIPHNDHTTSIQIEKTGATVATALMTKVVDIDAILFEGPLEISWAVNGTNWTGVAYVVLRLGTSASHYNEWKFDPENFSTTKWTKLASAFIDATQTGNGLDMSAITYLALGVQMDTAGTATAAAIQFDFVHFISAPFSTPGTAIVVDAGNVANTVRVQKLGLPSNENLATDAGASNTGTQRTISATDDPGVVNLDKLAATGATALNTAATSGVGTVDTITLTANTIYVDISFDTAAHYATPGVSPPTTLYGSKYYPGITYRIQTFKTTNLYVESAGAAGAFHVTCYIH